MLVIKRPLLNDERGILKTVSLVNYRYNQYSEWQQQNVTPEI